MGESCVVAVTGAPFWHVGTSADVGATTVLTTGAARVTLRCPELAARAHPRRTAYDLGTTPVLLKADAATPGRAYRRCVLPASWRAYRPPVTDVVIAAVFVVVGQLVTWGRLDEPSSFAGPRPANAVLNLLLMASLAWRRRAPLPAVGWAVAIFYLPQPLMQHDVTLLAGFVPLIVLTASAGYYCPRRQAVLAAAIGLAGLTTVTLATPWLRSPSYFAYNVVFLLAPWLAARGLREREDRAAALGAALARERTAQEAALAEVVATERARLARELHDIVAHSVSVMVIQMGAARLRLPPGTDSVASPLLAAEEVGRQALADLRRLLEILRADESLDQTVPGTPQAPQPGLASLDEMIATIRATGLLVDVHIEGDPVELPAGLSLTVYRIVQEALTNALRHSGSPRATVRLAYRDAGLLVEVIDAGPSARSGDSSGHGLIGIGERVALFGGRSDVGPVPGGGWRVQAELPVPSLRARDRRAAAARMP